MNINRTNIEVFITNIQNTFESEQIKEDILKKHPKLKVDFDLEDIDRVMRIEGFFNPNKIIKILASKNYKCEIILKNEVKIYNQSITELEGKLELLESETEDVIVKAEKGIKITRLALETSRERLNKKNFRKNSEEMHFFKNI